MNPTAAILLIGDELLSGRTKDANMHYLAGELSVRGIDLLEVRIVPDRQEMIVAAVNALRHTYGHVFTSGGIGPTHDDITADAMAVAFDVSIDVREDAQLILKAYYDASGQSLNAARLRMARIPQTAQLIENPVSAAPGFRLENVYVMAGVPSVFRAMVASVLQHITGGAPLLTETIEVMRGEGDVAEPLAKIAQTFPDLSFASYPFQKDGRYGTNLVIRGTKSARLSEGKAALLNALK